MKSREEEIRRVREKAKERYESDLVYEINGARGRSIRIYPYKCIISTSVTAGSLLTRNATDGEKTIYFRDVIGLQFKKPGLTLGFLQFETASGTMNNENTFTFEASSEKITREAYEYVVGVFDELKGSINDNRITEEMEDEIPDL